MARGQRVAYRACAPAAVTRIGRPTRSLREHRISHVAKRHPVVLTLAVVGSAKSRTVGESAAMNSIVLRLSSHTLSSAPPYLAGTGDQHHLFRRATSCHMIWGTRSRRAELKPISSGRQSAERAISSKSYLERG